MSQKLALYIAVAFVIVVTVFTVVVPLLRDAVDGITESQKALSGEVSYVPTSPDDAYSYCVSLGDGSYLAVFSSAEDMFKYYNHDVWYTEDGSAYFVSDWQGCPEGLPVISE
jgi:hypothetical protein